MRLFDMIKKSPDLVNTSNYEVILENIARANQRPVNAYFELTPLCTLSCPMCYVHLSKGEMEKRGGVLSAAQWIEFARDSQKLGVDNITLSGGEPLLRDDFFEIYSQLFDMGISISLMTNATLIDEKVIDLFKRKYPKSITVTVYGFSEETYEKACKNGKAFVKVRDAICRMQAEGLPVHMQTTTIAENIEDIEAISEFANTIGITYKHMSAIGSVRECSNESLEQSDVLDEQIKRYMKKLSVVPKGSIIQERGYRCAAGRSSFAINWRGIMQPCILSDFIQSDAVHNGIEKSWHEIKERASKILQLVECQQCELRYNCNSCIPLHYADTREFGKVSTRLCWKRQYPEDAARLIAEFEGKTEKVEH